MHEHVMQTTYADGEPVSLWCSECGRAWAVTPLGHEPAATICPHCRQPSEGSWVRLFGYCIACAQRDYAEREAARCQS